MKSLFGDEIPEVPEKQRTDKAHAAPPGTGPEGETCGTCRHRVQRKFAKTYQKCGLMRHHWSGGAATDIRCKDPACKHWEATDA